MIFLFVPTGNFILEKVQTHCSPNIHVTSLNCDLQLILILILIKRHMRPITVDCEIFNMSIARKCTVAFFVTGSKLRHTFKLRKVIFYMMI